MKCHQEFQISKPVLEPGGEVKNTMFQVHFGKQTRQKGTNQAAIADTGSKARVKPSILSETVYLCSQAARTQTLSIQFFVRVSVWG